MIPLILTCLLALLSSCSSDQKPPVRRYPVAIGEVSKQDVPIYIEAIGNVYSLRTVDVRPQVGGILTEAYVRQGQYVKKGDPLYKIDPRPYQAAFDKAKATLAKDEATLKFSEQQAERNKSIAEKDYISKLAYEQFLTTVEVNKAQVESDKADIETAQLNLEWTVPRSPIDGKISQYNIDPGNLVGANDANALTTIRQLTPADIRFNITQADFIRVQEARKNGRLKFEVFLPQAKDAPREGNIYFVDNYINLATGTILVKGTVVNEDEKFWPGDFVQVRLHLSTMPQALLVPEDAVKLGSEGYFIYVYNPEKSIAEYRKVKRGPRMGNKFVIEEGIQLGDKVITKGQNNLLPDASVYISTEEGAPIQKVPS